MWRNSEHLPRNGRRFCVVALPGHSSFVAGRCVVMFELAPLFTVLDMPLSSPNPPSLLRRFRDPETLFELLKQIGSGSYGSVHKARIIQSGKFAAVKMISMEDGRSTRFPTHPPARRISCLIPRCLPIYSYSFSAMRQPHSTTYVEQ